MGIFSRAAATGEARTMASVEEAVEAYTDLDHGLINVPCHIINEVHQAVWVGAKTDSEFWLGIYRCQNHFWGVELSRGNVEGARAGKDQMNWLQIRKLQGDLGVADMGLMNNGGVQSLAFALTQMPFKEG